MNVILVVDDEPDILDLLITLLDDEGYAVLAASDGLGALELLSGAPVDLIVADVMMPRLDGVELVRTIRERNQLRDLPVILMSAAPPPALDGLGNSTFLSKPFDLSMLLDTIERALDVLGPDMQTPR
ncbi:MAG TPA: response regulator [Thermomicrobiales bacterium]|nr:response regulator [Thermomicrobiales bacterium]